MNFFKEQLQNLVAIAKAEKKAVGIGASGIVDGSFFPLIEYDKKPFSYVLEMGFVLYEELNLDRFAIFKTKNGWHLRYYYNNDLTIEQVRCVVNMAQTNKEFRKIVNKAYPINRVAGKHAGKDIVFIGEFGKLKQNPDSYCVKVGKSLLRLHCLLGKINLKKDLVLQ